MRLVVSDLSVIINTDPTAVAVSLAEGLRRSLRTAGASFQSRSDVQPRKRDMAAKMYGGFIDVGGFTDLSTARFARGRDARKFYHSLSIPPLLVPTPEARRAEALHPGGGAPSDGASNLATCGRSAAAVPFCVRSLASQPLRRRHAPRVVSVRAASSSSSDARFGAERAAYLVVEFDRPVVSSTGYRPRTRNPSARPATRAGRTSWRARRRPTS